MPQPGDVSQAQPSAEDSFLELLVETLAGMEESPRGQFLRQYFRTVAQIELSEAQSNQYWEAILRRHRELSESQNRRVSLKAVILDVLSSANVLRVPILMEYDEFKKLQLNAATDALTGLHNRRLFDESSEKEMNRAKRYGHHLAIVLIDLHKLKEVNDSRGHLEGDRVLQMAASTLRRTLRASDMAFRIGGDEFALLLPQTDSEQATTLCRRLRAQYEAEVRPLRVSAGVTLDYGVAVLPEDGDQLRALMTVADERLYELKHTGRAASPRVVSMESPQREVPERESAPRAVPAPGANVPKPAAAAAPGPEPVRSSEARKWERVSLAGTKAHAVLGEGGQKSARVIDLSTGGLALLMGEGEEIPDQFNAVLHVPILPPVRVLLRRSYVLHLEGGRMRVGCSFVS